jgi:hypothetical protein
MPVDSELADRRMISVSGRKLFEIMQLNLLTLVLPSTFKEQLFVMSHLVASTVDILSPSSMNKEIDKNLK